MNQRRSFLKSAAAFGSVVAIPAAAATMTSTERVKASNGIRVGNLYFSSGTTGVRPEARKDPKAYAGDIKEQTHTILKTHKANLESMGSSLANVIKVTVFLADVKKEKAAMNEVYAEYFPKDAPARSAFGVEFPDEGTRVEIELIAWVP